MTIEQIRALQAGDQVRWTDPDGELCSRTYTLAYPPEIEQLGPNDTGEVRIVDRDGSVLECFPGELS